jgi:hypothetical protein
VELDGFLESLIIVAKYDMAISPIASTEELMSKNDRYVARRRAVKKGEQIYWRSSI